MSDKKVERPSRSTTAEHVQPPLAKHASTSEEPAFEAPRRADDKGKATLLERFRERDLRFREEHTDRTPDEGGGAPAVADPPAEDAADTDAGAAGGDET